MAEPSKLATVAPLLLGLTGPVGAGVGLLGTLFQAGRREKAGAAADAAVQQLDAPLGELSQQQLLDEMLQLEQSGLPGRDTLQQQMAFQQQQATQQAAIDAAQTEAQQQTLKQQFEIADKIRDDIRKPIESVTTGARQLGVIENAPRGFAGDVAIVNSFARLLNPGERLTQDDIEAVSGDPRLSAQLSKLIRKGLTTGEDLSLTERAQILQAGALLQQQQQQVVQTQIAPLLRNAEIFGIGLDLIIDPGVFMDDAQLDELMSRYIEGIPAGGAAPIPAPTPDNPLQAGDGVRTDPPGTRRTASGSIILE